MTLSIIIPVYNVAGTLTACLASIAPPTDGTTEVILVDDGSTDGSGDICDKWCEENPHSHVIHQENMGLSGARNTGMRMATGDYITFVDSDDMTADGTFASLMRHLAQHPETDILEYPVTVKCRRDTTGGTLLSFGDATYHDAHSYWYLTKAYRHTFACNKVYRRTTACRHRFIPGRKFEDVAFMLTLLGDDPVVSTCGCGNYYYTENPCGITATASGSDLNDLLTAHLQGLPWALKGGTRRQQGEYYSQLLNIQIDVYERTGLAPTLPAVRFLNTPKLLFMNLLGLKTTCILNKTYHQIRRLL